VSLDLQRTALSRSDLPPLLERVADAAGTVPGVARAAVSAIAPLSGGAWNNIFEIPGAPALSERERSIFINAVSPGWFRTYGTQLLAGRDFTLHDTAGGLPVAVVNEAFVRKYMAGSNPLGRTLRQIARPGETSPELQIVGLVEDAAYRSVREAVLPTVYLPLPQAADNLPPFASLAIRPAHGRPSSLVRSVTTALARVNPDLSLSFTSVEQQVNASIVRERIMAMLSGFFGALALLLAGIGLYGVTSYAVSRRRTEIGIRMALGADGSSVRSLVLGEGARLMVLGLSIGIVGAIAMTRVLTALLFNVSPYDVMTFTSVAVALGGVAMFATYLPARRASKVDPIEALRSE
jgi:predicted permease